MTVPASQVPSRRRAHWRVLVTVGLVALAVVGCQKRGRGDITGSVPGPQQATPEAWRRQADLWAPRFEANPGDATAALQYARALRMTDQKPQAVAVLQQAAIRSPSNPEILAAYGKALSDVGRYKEASEALGRAHSPERPDWRVLTAQGAVADQTGDHALAQQYYEAATKLAPDEPSVLSNLGLSYALSKRIPDAERVSREAAAHARADGRVRQNLALVLIIAGKSADAETVLRQDMSAEDATAMIADLKLVAAQPAGLAGGRRADGKAKPAGA